LHLPCLHNWIIHVCVPHVGSDGFFQYTGLRDKGVYTLTVAGTLANGTVKTISNTFRSGTRHCMCIQ